MGELWSAVIKGMGVSIRLSKHEIKESFVNNNKVREMGGGK